MDKQAQADVLTTSGQAVVDKRFEYAVQWAERGEYEAALDLLNQCLELTPDWPALYFQQGIYYQAIGNRDAALAAFRTCLVHDPLDHLGAGIKLSLLGAMPAPGRLPEDYVRALFDQYAPRFDSALIESLSYAVPQLLYDLIEDVRPAPPGSERILDLGCGTGLAGERFARRAGTLEGVDLSAGMIAQAAAKRIYTRLDTAEIAAFLQSRPSEPYHLILAADVFVYLGALEPILSLIARHLTPGGLLAFSVQKTAGEGFLLGADHRFAHARPYIERCLALAGLPIRRLEEAILRTDGPHDIPGFLVIAEKPAPAPLGTGLATLPAEADNQADEPGFLREEPKTT